MSLILAEKDYNDLYKYSLNIAHKFMGYQDSSYDIAQNALLQLISTKSEVTSPYAWLRTVVKREALKHIEEAKRLSEITVNKSVEPRPLKQEEFESDDIPIVDDSIVKKALSLEDYRIYNKFKKLNFVINKYVEKEKVSYNRAAFLKKRVKRNLLAYVLWQDGWRNSNKVLDFTRFSSITRFIKTVIKSVEEDSLTNLKNYLRGVDLEQVKTVFNEVVEFREWSIAYNDGDFDLTIVCLKKDKNPKVPIFKIHFDKKNYIQILQIYDAVIIPIDVEKVEIDLEKFLVKGKLDLTLEEVTALLKYQK